MLGNEYYVLETSSDNEMFIHPAHEDVDNLLMKNDYIDPTIVLRFYFDEDMVKEPMAIDYIEEGISPFISKKLKEIIELFDYFPAIQFVESTISFKDQIFEEYFYLNITNRLQCVDKDLSEFTLSRTSGKIRSFDKLILFEEALKQRSLQQRLIFRLEEKTGTILFHESIVEAVMKVEPTGLHFYPVDEWDTFVAAR